jgi:hypothetical protein
MIPRGINHREIGVVHGEFAEIERTSGQPHKIAPLGQLGLIIGRVAVDDFKVRRSDVHRGDLPTNMGCGKQPLGVYKRGNGVRLG